MTATQYPGASARRLNVDWGKEIRFLQNTAQPVQDIPILDCGIGRRCYKGHSLRRNEHINRACLSSAVSVCAGVKDAIGRAILWCGHHPLLDRKPWRLMLPALRFRRMHRHGAQFEAPFRPRKLTSQQECAGRPDTDFTGRIFAAWAQRILSRAYWQRIFGVDDLPRCTPIPHVFPYPG